MARRGEGSERRGEIGRGEARRGERRGEEGGSTMRVRGRVVLEFSRADSYDPPAPRPVLPRSGA